MNQHKVIWTVGHSTRTSEEFLNLLQENDIQKLVDVRRFPGSRKYPQYNQDELKSMLNNAHINYCLMEDLGGRRKPNPESKNTIWQHPSFRAYADYMETEQFQRALRDLEIMAKKEKCAIMCSEAVWWRCHRSMISDQLKAEGWEVLHIMGNNQVQEHPFTKPAQVTNGKLHYGSNI